MAALPELGRSVDWAAIAASEDQFDDTTARFRQLLEHPELLKTAGGFVIGLAPGGLIKTTNDWPPP